MLFTGPENANVMPYSHAEEINEPLWSFCIVHPILFVLKLMPCSVLIELGIGEGAEPSNAHDSLSLFQPCHDGPAG